MTTAYWCVLVAVLLPYLCFGIARNRGRDSEGRRVRDNHNPRDFPNNITGLAKRAWGAHLNSFESLPGFSAAVIIAHLAHTSQQQIDVIAVVWVAVRLAYVGFYLTDRATLRTSAEIVSLLCVLGLFFAAALA